jgi:hypothetical protein
MRSRTVWSCGLVIVVGAVVACSSSAPSAPGTGSADVIKSDKKKTDAGKESATSKEKDAGTTAKSATCASTKTYSECETCCLGKDEVERKAGDDAFASCLCAKVKAECPAECAESMCNLKPNEDVGFANGDPCENCGPDRASCESAGEKACAADAKCAAAGRCLEDSKCREKYDDDDEAIESSKKDED